MATGILELEDYRKVWISEHITYKCCGVTHLSVFHEKSQELECPQCHKITTVETEEPYYDT
jgi:hypothetical protein